MKNLKRALELGLLLIGCALSLASVGPDEGIGSWDDGSWITADERWMVGNLYDGQTAVATDLTIELQLGWRDFSGTSASPNESEKSALDDAMNTIRLYPVDEPDSPLDLQFATDSDSSTVTFAELEEDTRYLFDLTGIAGYLEVDRIVPEPIEFATTRGPRVTDLWRNEDTLIIAFSEPMDPDSLTISHGSVDVIWTEGSQLHSIASDLNLASYVWDVQGNLFRVAPIGFSEPVIVKVGGEARGLSGGWLDGDEDNHPGEVEDDFLDEVNVHSLDECYSREDIPAPCVIRDEVEMFDDWEEEDWW